MQGLGRKLSLLESFLAEPPGKFLVVCLSEHWLGADDMCKYAVAGYKVAAYFSRSIHIRGGVAILVRCDVQFVRLDFDDCCVEVDGEVVGIRISVRRLVVLSVYRSPSGDVDAFLRVLTGVLARLCNGDDYVVLAGDFNFHFQNARDAGARLLRDLLSEYGLTTNFCDPTRFDN